MTATPKFAHAVMMTNRLAEMRDWYCTVLDAHVVFENEMLCFITYDDEHHRLAFATAPDGSLVDRPPNSTGLFHTAFTFPDLDALLERYAMLRDKGIEPRVPIQHGVTTSMYYRDPDGQFVEMQIDNFATAQEATDYMHGPEYAADPIGPVYDAARLYADYKAGVPASTLTSRAWVLDGPAMPHAMELFAQAD